MGGPKSNENPSLTKILSFPPRCLFFSTMVMSYCSCAASEIAADNPPNPAPKTTTFFSFQIINFL